jgi:EpsI family protein
VSQPNRPAGFLTTKHARLLTLVLIAQAAAFYGFSRREFVPVNRPLAEVPATMGAWNKVSEGVIEPEIQDILKADDLLTRTYASNSYNIPAHLFVAFFRSQRTGQAPHSPKNCLPGNGWVPTVNDVIHIPIEGRPSLEVNRFIVAKGDQKSVVLYWYQSRDRVVASEYTAKFYVLADALRYNRTDTALVKVVVPVIEGQPEKSEKAAIEFVQALFQPLRQHFPA